MKKQALRKSHGFDAGGYAMAWKQWASLAAVAVSFALAIAVAWSHRLERARTTVARATEPIVVIVSERAVYPARLTLRVDTTYHLLLTGVGGSYAVSVPALGLGGVAPAERITKVSLTPRVLGRFSPAPGSERSFQVTVVAGGEPEQPQEELAVLAVAGQLVPDRLIAPAGKTITLSAVSLGGSAALAIEGSGLSLQISQQSVATVRMAAPGSGAFLYSLTGGWHGKGVLRFVGRGGVGATEEAAIGQSAPDFTGESLSGRAMRLSELAGRPVALIFWSSWCAPCRAQLPVIQRAFAGQGEQVRVWTVMVNEARGRVARFMEAFGFTFPTLIDEHGQLAALYRVKKLPTALFIDSGGMVRVRYEGILQAGLVERFFAEAGGRVVYGP